MDKLAWQFIDLCYLIFVMYWALAAFSVKRAVEKQDWRERLGLVLVMFLAFESIQSRGALGRYTSITVWRPTPALDVACAAIVFAGLVTMLWARTVLGRNWSGSMVFRENHELIERGPYGYVRHPIYSGLFLMALGTATLSGRVGGFLAFVILVVGFWFKLRQEERLMAKHFPEAYENYRTRVKALIPFVF
jgi:protein-S-isoprenylcysteine O-methyltransferase Ste14